MKTLMSFACAALLLMAASTPALAQGGGKDAEARAKQMTERMTKALDLDAAQQERVAQMNLDFAKKMAELRGDAQGDMDRLESEHEAALSKVLNAEQMEKLKAQRAEQKAKWEGRGGQGRGQRGGGEGPDMGARIERLSSELNLSAEQKAQAEAIAKEFGEKREAQRAELKDASSEERMAAMEAHRKAFEEAFTAILTPEQKTAFEKLKSERDGAPRGRGQGERRPPKGGNKR